VEKLVGYAVVAVIAWTVISGYLQPPPTIAGKTPIPTKPTAYHGWKEDTDGIGTVVATNRSTGERLGVYVLGDDGLLHQTGEQADNGVISLSYQPDVYAGKWNFDVGPIVVAANIPGTPAVQAGLRFSPCRLGYGWFAPDVAVTNDAVGVGGSLYLPERTAGPVWSRIGAGAWYMAPWSGGSPGFALGLSASITH
jgi:hypothetical protein